MGHDQIRGHMEGYHHQRDGCLQKVPLSDSWVNVALLFHHDGAHPRDRRRQGLLVGALWGGTDGFGEVGTNRGFEKVFEGWLIKRVICFVNEMVLDYWGVIFIWDVILCFEIV